MMNLKKLVSVFALMALCASSALAAKPLEGKKLVMATSPTFPPFEFADLDPNTGNEKIMGFDIDMVDAIAEKLGFTYTIVHTNFQGLLGELSSGRVDFVISGMSPTEERKKTVDFSIPYYYCQTAVLQTKNAGVYDVATMKGKPIAAAFGTEYHKFAAAAGADIHALDTDAICLQELLAGRVVGLMLDAASASARQKKYPDAQLVFHVIPQKDLDAMRSAAVSDCFACVFPKGSELEALFSGALKELMAEGFMRKNYEKWIGPMPESSKNPY